MRIRLLFILMIVSLGCAGQNLVPNPSFEDTVSCPTSIGDFSVAEWYNPTTASPDYFHLCSSGNNGVPQNVFGYQLARTGHGYAGGHGSDLVKSEVREYIQCELDSSLEANVHYIVSFYVSRADSSNTACDGLGALLTIDPISSTTANVLQTTPQIVAPVGVPITDDLDWNLVSDTIVANGGERFLTIGIFANNSTITSETVDGGWQLEPYYFYDDVSVQRLNALGLLTKSVSKISVFPNPAKNYVVLSSDSPVLKWRLSNIDNQVVLNGSPNSKHVHINLHTLESGVYLIYIQTSLSESTKRIIHINP